MGLRQIVINWVNKDTFTRHYHVKMSIAKLGIVIHRLRPRILAKRFAVAESQPKQDCTQSTKRQHAVDRIERARVVYDYPKRRKRKYSQTGISIPFLCGHQRYTKENNGEQCP